MKTNLKTRIVFLGLITTCVLVTLNIYILRWEAETLKHIFQREIRLDKTTRPADTRGHSGVPAVGKLLNSNSKEVAELPPSQKDTEPKLILFYTALFGRFPWPNLETSFKFTHWANTPCAVRSCKISYKKSDLAVSDVVIFHGRDMPRVEEMRQASEKRHPKQKWVFFTQESPYFLYYDPAMYDGYFNWTMSYRRDSDFFVPYRSYARLGSEDKVPEAGKNYAEGKDKLVVWLVSNCGYMRDNVVKKLMQYIPVDVYGNCARLFNQTQKCRRFSSECGQLLKRYKFYLSFENSFCNDYITEKYWYTPFENDIVPVVMGGANYDPQVAIPGSFINVVDFPSIKELAHYLLYLSNNDTAYSQFFQWKMNFKTVLPESWTCQMCAALSNNTVLNTNKVYRNLYEFWGTYHACGKNEQKIREMLLA